jgi:hypothetical protein
MVALLGGLVGLVKHAVKHAKRIEAERVAALQAVAERTGWAFRAEVPFETIPKLDRFELFRQGGHTRKLRNLMTSPPGDVRAVIFEFSYTVSTGKSTTTVSQTVLYTTSDTLDLPEFSVRPENFLHNIATALGFQDIDIDNRPVFSDMFLLRGKDEARVREVFGDGVCEFFEQRQGVCAAGEAHELLYWRAGKRAKPEEIEHLIAEGDELAARFVGA